MAAQARHFQCAWCGRLVHPGGKPHGEPMPLTRGYTHGICVECQRTQKERFARFKAEREERLAANPTSRSKGHVAFIGSWEYFKTPDGGLWRAPRANEIMPDGYRGGARFEATAVTAEMALKLARKAFESNPTHAKTAAMGAVALGNPRPPSDWFDRMLERVRKQYPGRTKRDLDRIVAGIWWRYPASTRQKMLRRYDNPVAVCPSCLEALSVPSRNPFDCPHCGALLGVGA